MIEVTSEEFQKKLEMLSYIPRYSLENLAKKYGLPKSIKTDELRKSLAEKATFEEIEDIYEKFEDAGNVTVYLFKFKKENVSRLNEANELLKLLKDVGMENIFRSKKELKLTSEPQIVFVDIINGDMLT